MIICSEKLIQIFLQVSAFFFSLFSYLVAAVRRNDVENLKLILEGKSGKFTKDELKLGLISASKCGSLECLQVLIDYGVDANCIDENDNTLLMLAVRNEHPHLVKILASKVKNINNVNSDGNTVIHLAAWHGYSDVIKMLMESGGDITILDRHKNTALMLASEKGHIETVKFLIDAGIDVNAMNCHNETALHKAVFADNAEINSILMDAGAILDAPTIWGHTPLHGAVLFDKHQALQNLLKLGSSVNRKDEVQWTVLHIACRNSCTTCFNILLNYCNIADINESDPLGLTPLSVAVHYKFLEGVKLLIKAGALIKGFHGECLLKISMCIQDGKYDMAKVLVMSGQLKNAELWEQMKLLKQNKLDDEGKEVVKNLLMTPFSLQHLCRIYIRCELTNLSEGERHGSSVYKYLKKEDVYSLPLPEMVKEFLLFSDL